MKKLLMITLVLTLLLPSMVSWAEKSLDQKITDLEKQVEELKAAQTEQKEKVVKAKFPVELYGFVAGQVFWGSARTQLYANTDNQRDSFVAQSSVMDRTVLKIDDSWIGLTPQNSRLGLNWTGSKVSKHLTLGGKLEMDFLNPTGGASPRPRIRLYYLTLSGKVWSLLAGQQWDSFSPLNTNSLSLGGNLWYQGNLGFRRPQLRFTYDFPFATDNNIEVQVAVNNPSNMDLITNVGNESSIPYFSGLLQYTKKMKYGDFLIAASATGGAHRQNNIYDKMWGIAGSLSVPLHKFLKISGEVQYGRDLGNYLTYAGTTRNIKSFDAWAQISSRWHKMLETNIGYGIGNLPRSKVTANNTAFANMLNGIYRNQNIFANFKFYPVEPFYFGVEYNNMRTGYRGNGTSTAQVIMSNFVYTF